MIAPLISFNVNSAERETTIDPSASKPTAITSSSSERNMEENTSETFGSSLDDLLPELATSFSFSDDEDDDGLVKISPVPRSHPERVVGAPLLEVKDAVTKEDSPAPLQCLFDIHKEKIISTPDRPDVTAAFPYAPPHGHGKHRRQNTWEADDMQQVMGVLGDLNLEPETVTGGRVAKTPAKSLISSMSTTKVAPVKERIHEREPLHGKSFPCTPPHAHGKHRRQNTWEADDIQQVMGFLGDFNLEPETVTGGRVAQTPAKSLITSMSTTKVMQQCTPINERIHERDPSHGKSSRSWKKIRLAPIEEETV